MTNIATATQNTGTNNVFAFSALSPAGSSALCVAFGAHAASNTPTAITKTAVSAFRCTFSLSPRVDLVNPPRSRANSNRIDCRRLRRRTRSERGLEPTDRLADWSEHLVPQVGRDQQADGDHDHAGYAGDPVVVPFHEVERAHDLADAHSDEQESARAAAERTEEREHHAEPRDEQQDRHHGASLARLAPGDEREVAGDER